MVMAVLDRHRVEPGNLKYIGIAIKTSFLYCNPIDSYDITVRLFDTAISRFEANLIEDLMSKKKGGEDEF
jgi:hypothetical protein